MLVGPRDKILTEDEEMVELVEVIENFDDYSDINDDDIIVLDDILL